MLKRMFVVISGHVQRVFFRSFIKENADKLKIQGYVKNLPSGEVEAVFEGQKENVDAMMQVCKKGHKRAIVEGIKAIEQKPTKEFTSFTIIR